MTQDFRQLSPQSTQSRSPDSADQAVRSASAIRVPPLAAQGLIVKVLNGSALAFFIGGLWLLIGEPGWLPAEIAPFVGAAFILVAASDLAAVKVLKLVWSKKQGGVVK